MQAHRPRRGRPPKGVSRAIDTELPDLLDLWNRAVAEPHGIAIASQAPNALAQRLYRARRETEIAAYFDLVVIEMPDEVRLVRRGEVLDEITPKP